MGIRHISWVKIRENDESPETLRLQGFALWWTIQDSNL
ncbi:hypothetical protein BACCAP_00586 [Pseudoflavonifractor capillosus ATCC 29799]|uniref:Uncharacterized protein n=1 Tax=Pseudoflavonifractor capillosus ATCC 29799 TaxID=411467 RepID=A6NQW2_9FIRM|nr:hypothetical protein BACCAP_00586 [Pseudoflavonifractor capillosus ATCC 29799]